VTLRTLTDQPTGTQTQPSKPKRPPTRGSWRKGAGSPNPGGRPRSAYALSTAIREHVDPVELLQIALRIARTAPSEQTRLSALQWLRDSGFVRPPERHELSVGPRAADEDDELALEGLSIDQLRELADLDRRRAAILALPAGPVPDVDSDNPKRSHELVGTVASDVLLQDRASAELP